MSYVYLHFFDFISFDIADDEPAAAVYYTPDYRISDVLPPSTSYFMVL